MRELRCTFYDDFISELFNDNMDPAYLFGSPLPDGIDSARLVGLDISEYIITCSWPKIRAFRKIDITGEELDKRFVNSLMPVLIPREPTGSADAIPRQDPF